MTTAPGLEGLLFDELVSLGLEPRKEASGVTSLTGEWGVAARVLVHSRIASRLLLSIRRFPAGTQAMLYDQVRRIDWPAIFPPSRTMAVHAHGRAPDADFTLALAPLKIKDAVCDEFRKRVNVRPSVDRHNPDVRLEAFFFNDQCEVSIDLSGEPLHRRGYREEGAEAPLRENRAAALLAFAGYDGSRLLIDPFCGSGTIAIEAALLATRHAPGLLRRPADFAAAKLFPAARGPLDETWQAARQAVRADAPHPIIGRDAAEPALAVGRRNALKARVSSIVRFEKADARGIEAVDAFIVTNPPYGERLEDPEAAVRLIKEFTHQVKHHCQGSRLALVVPRGDLEHAVGFKPARRLAVESGPLGLRFLAFDIYAGSRKPGRASGELPAGPPVNS